MKVRCKYVCCLTKIRKLYIKVKIMLFDRLHYGLQVIPLFAADTYRIALSLRLNFDFAGFDKLIDCFALLFGQALLYSNLFFLHSPAWFSLTIPTILPARNV